MTYAVWGTVHGAEAHRLLFPLGTGEDGDGGIEEFSAILRVRWELGVAPVVSYSGRGGR